jgi:hypothetical protein
MKDRILNKKPLPNRKSAQKILKYIFAAHPLIVFTDRGGWIDHSLIETSLTGVGKALSDRKITQRRHFLVSNTAF